MFVVSSKLFYRQNSNVLSFLRILFKIQVIFLYFILFRNVISSQYLHNIHAIADADADISIMIF